MANFENIKRFVKTHDSGKNGTVIINNYNSTSDSDQLNILNLTTNSVDTYNLNTKNADIVNANVVYLMSDNGKINKLSGVELDYTLGNINDLTSHVIKTDKLTVNDTATIENIINNNLTSKNITTDYLTVNKSAHFFELIIDKIRSVQGTQMNTAANCIADFVQAYTSTGQLTSPTASNVAYYRVYWKNTDDDGREIKNDWLPLDQALCESFNVQQGANYDVSNKYYWRKVLRTSSQTGQNIKYVNFNTKTVSNTAITDYEIIFNNGFSFNTPNFINPFTDFNVVSQITNEWDDTTNTWTCSTTQFGLQLTYFTNVDCDAEQNALGHGVFSFDTNKKTMLNIGVYYDDGSFDFFPADTYKTSYSITTAENKMIEAFIINSATIDIWNACNWIDLSNSDKATSISGKYEIPSEGDNICQLGYRYTELANPTQDDINRASAIIIAAYTTPDNGIVPPSYAQYQNITDYNLSSHRKSYFDANGCKIIGNFVVQANNTEIPLDDYIQTQTGGGAADIMIQSNGVNINNIILQTNSQYEISNINNFPEYIDLVVVDYVQATSLNVQSANINLFGRQLDLLRIMSGQDTDTGNGIYIMQVTYGGTDRLSIHFGFRNGPQTITNGTSIDFSGQVTVDGTQYSLSKSISVAAVTSVEGTDAELYKLEKIKEYAQIQKDKSYDRTLVYKLLHIVGTSSSNYTPTTEKLQIIEYNTYGTALNTTTLTSSDWSNNCWTYDGGNYIINDWYKLSISNRPAFIQVNLLDVNNNVLDNTIVSIILQPSSLFIVEDDLTQSIQANTTAINDEVNTRTSQYSSITQTVGQLNSTVTSHTSTINDINIQVSEIDQKADRIDLHVTNVETDLNSLETDIQTTGIDITNSKIILDANNTEITGDLELKGDFESYNETTQNRTRITTSSAGTSGLIMSGPDRVDQITGEPDPYTQEVDLIKMEFTTTAGARAGTIKVQSANSNNIYTNIWQESIGISNDQNYITTRPEAITYGLRPGNTYDIQQIANDQSMTTSWPALLTGCLKVTKINALTYNAKIYDSIIIIDQDFGNKFTINLPAPSTAAGKQVFIKNKTSRNGYITCVGSTDQNPLIMDHEDTDKDKQRDIQRDSTMLICDGDHWIIFSYQY